MRRRGWTGALGALAVALAASPAAANDGLFVKLADGSLAINQPDLFASAINTIWSNKGKYCAALKAQLPTANGTVASCTPNATPEIGVTLSHGDPAVLMIGIVELQGSSPFESKSCPFTDWVVLTIETPLQAHGTAVGLSSIGFGAPSVTAKVNQETWGAPCASEAGAHPGGLGPVIPGFAVRAASDADMPGASLVDALAPFDSQLLHALAPSAYTVSTGSGDIVYTVTGSRLRQDLDRAPALTHAPHP
jgi:hypothetical protein